MQDENQLSRGFSSLNDLLDGNVAGKSTQVNSGQKIPSSQNWIPPSKAQEWVSFIQNQKMGGGGGSLTCTPKNISPTGPNSKTKSRKTRALAIIGIEKNKIWATWFQGDERNQLWSHETDFPFLMGKWQMLQLVLAMHSCVYTISELFSSVQLRGCPGSFKLLHRARHPVNFRYPNHKP